MASQRKIQVTKKGVILIRDVEVNYDETPAEAMRGIKHDPRIDSFPQELWSGGKTGIATVTIPILTGRNSFKINRKRVWQAGRVGFGSPAELFAALKSSTTRRRLHREHSLDFVAAIGSSDEELLHDAEGKPLSLYVSLDGHHMTVSLMPTKIWTWCRETGLVGAPIPTE